jgi:glycosyltransferase involved in cell wall biosynthesis
VSPNQAALPARITVLMPVKHYYPQFLRQAMQSVLAQTSPNWRMIVIAENEETRLLQILREFENRRIRTVTNRGRGLAGAFNTGMRAAETEFVAILLADDLWARNVIEVLEANIRAHPQIDFHHSGLVVTDEALKPVSDLRHPPVVISRDDFVRTSPVKHLLCWRREKALSFGGMDESIDNVGPDDNDFPWTMLDHDARFGAIDECLYMVRDHRESYRLTTHIPRSVHLREIRRRLRKHGVPPRIVRRQITGAKRSFLRQCLFHNRFDMWLKQNFIRIDPRNGYRNPMVWNPDPEKVHATLPGADSG